MDLATHGIKIQEKIITLDAFVHKHGWQQQENQDSWIQQQERISTSKPRIRNQELNAKSFSSKEYDQV